MAGYVSQELHEVAEAGQVGGGHGEAQPLHSVCSLVLGQFHGGEEGVVEEAWQQRLGQLAKEGLDQRGDLVYVQTLQSLSPLHLDLC